MKKAIACLLALPLALAACGYRMCQRRPPSPPIPRSRHRHPRLQVLRR